ncbi:hydantoinase B/oxoprolinase family protein [Roseomonas sp. HF4]|uniref:hydantoinase B/oxoprolinase family protein n=1 Tax=Roseomonas sp. HF4 TaxID=2562313 RepID=UPI0010BFC04F|nr:hydantoinase B/oxoprolinase family protein [Roseomonas sp. HF4]
MRDGVVLGVDIGGTFTDIVALDTASRRVVSTKVLTTPGDPNLAVIEGIQSLFASQGLDRARVLRVVHATTLFTNALVQRQGARVGFITTAGFADTLELRRERKFELYDLAIRMPEPLVPAERRLEVAERIDARGSILEAVSPDDVVAVAMRLRAMGCDSIALGFLNSIVNAANEQAAMRALAQAFPDLALCASYQVANEIREFERFSTTVANAFIAPLADRYLGAFGRCIAEDCGIAAPVLLMLSSGGLAPIEVARRQPIALLESGPAAGALAAAWFAGQAGIADVLALDLGGTTAKLCVVEGGAPLIARRFEAARERRFVPESGLPLCLASVDLIEIGAGGGSIARRDGLGLLKVGPRSAGSEPGPACYGRGGTEPTLTDANLALGLLDPEGFAGGTLRLAPAAATSALERLGESLGLDATRTALGIRDLANENMASAARVHAAERGIEPDRLALVVTGGGGPLHGAEVARKLGIRTVLCPPAAGVASAIGLCLAPLRVDRSRFLGRPLAGMAGAEIEAAFLALEQDAMGSAGLPMAGATLTRSADMRYLGQGFEIEVALPAGPYDDTEDLLAAFRAAYARIFSRTIDWAAAELVALRVVASLPLVDAQAPLLLDEAVPRTGETMRDIVLDDGRVARARALGWGVAAGEVAGPALLAQAGSTLVLGPGDVASPAALGMACLALAQEANAGNAFDAVRTEVLWRRLIGVVDEASAALVRSAFSTVVRESDDFSVVITDAAGTLLAQGHKSIPSFIGSLPRTVEHFRAVFGAGIAEGDILITNDPWWGTGHLADISLAMPIFHRGRLVAFAASTAHAPDIGGRSGAQRIADVHEEGFQIPPLKLARQGVLDDAILALLAKNVRAPEEVLGDLHGQMAALHLVRRRVLTLLEDWALDDLDAFAAASCGRTDAAVRAALAGLPHGSWDAEEETDGMDGVPIRLKARVTISPDAVTVDYTGSSAQIPAALNVAWCYTFAFTAYALKCVLDPESPNNAGSQRAIRLIAPEGSIVNHAWPFSGGNRALVGHYLPALVLRALAAAIPGKVIAPTGSPIWSFLLRGQREDGSRFALKTFFNGGMGAGAHGDGAAALSWPSNVSSTPVEVIEQQAPIRVLHRRIRRGSGGAGRGRGGDGLEQAHLLLAGGPYIIGFNAERTRAAAAGLLGGAAGACGMVAINATAVDIKNSPFTLRDGDVVTIATPGGGGYGDPA